MFKIKKTVTRDVKFDWAAENGGSVKEKLRTEFLLPEITSDEGWAKFSNKFDKPENELEESEINGLTDEERQLKLAEVRRDAMKVMILGVHDMEDDNGNVMEPKEALDLVLKYGVIFTAMFEELVTIRAGGAKKPAKQR